MSIRVIASVLTADFAHLGDELVALEDAGVDRIHWDVMDGKFVPNLTFGPDVIAACRKAVDLPFEVHVQCERPEELLPRYVEAGCELLILHPETLRQPHHTFAAVGELGARAGIALAPGTPLVNAHHLLDLAALLLVMTVNPGFGRQPHLASMLGKVAAARELIGQQRWETNDDRDIELEVDGGIGPDTIGAAAAAGADTFVCGSALWRYETFKDAVADLRSR